MLRIYNTLSKKLEEFKPLEGNKVTFYHCGPTVYWVQHIGNLRGMTMADLARRSLTYLDYDVRFARNYTDVGHLTSDEDEGEDKMEKGAKREGLTPQEIADKYINLFEQDTAALNIIKPDYQPRATEYIPQMIEITEALHKKGFAYVTAKAVYFDVTKFPDYNKLNRQKIEMNRKGSGSGTVEDPDKKNPEDFALWFFRTGAHKNALQYWPSPFTSPEVENGNGFPGWHIECSAMAIALLGETIDIHMGGIEHIDVHHTNEIAQSECYTGKPFVNYWMHNEHLLVDNEKMSKSTGTSYSLNDIVSWKDSANQDFEALDLRFLFLQAHYRSKQNFTKESLQAARKARKDIVGTLKMGPKEEGKILEEYNLKFKKAISEDFNIPKALSVVYEILKSDTEAKDQAATIYEFDKVLGLDLKNSLSRGEELKRDYKGYLDKNPEVDKILKEREEARKNKDWKESDRLRDLLSEKYLVKVKDTENGQEVQNF